MSLAPTTLARELDVLRDRVDRLFGEWPNLPVRMRDWPAWAREDGMWMPLDVQETETSIVVKASLPGVKPEDVKVEVEHGMLSVQAESKEEKKEDTATYHMQERRYGSYRRAVALPTAVNEEAVEAKLTNGVLEIVMPKTAPSTPHRIPVKTAD